MKEEYPSFKVVAIAINMNALEQRMITKQEILRSLELGVPRETKIKPLEEQIHYTGIVWLNTTLLIV